MGAMRLIVWHSNVDKNWQKVKGFYKLPPGYAVLPLSQRGRV